MASFNNFFMSEEVSIQLVSLASREESIEIKANLQSVVSIQLVSLASRESPNKYTKRWEYVVSIQLVSLASREPLVFPLPSGLKNGFHSISFSSE